MRLRVLVALLLLVRSTICLAGAIIVNGNVTLTPEEIRDVFLGEKQFIGDVRVVPVDNSLVQTEFLAKVLQTDSQKYYARWTRKAFREGIAPPAVKGSDAEVIAFVRSTPGAIGYIKTPTGGVKVLQGF